MKNKRNPVFSALACALCCVFMLAACNDGEKITTKVKDEAQWKQAIAAARDSENVDFYAEFREDAKTLEIHVKAVGSVQYILMRSSDAETVVSTLEYYYDGEYFYLNVADRELDYTWQKINAELSADEFAEPLVYVGKVYSGELLQDALGIDVTVKTPAELSNSYAEAQYGYNAQKYGSDAYVIIEGDPDADGFAYSLNFRLEYNYLRLSVRSANGNLVHTMGDEHDDFSVAVTVPTESVREVD